MDVRLITFQIHGDERGSLIAIENSKNIPFDIKRVYYIFGTQQGVRRGMHAHRNLEQIMICLSGSCKVLVDDGISKEIYHLSSPQTGLHIKDLIWREMYDFSDDCVLMVLASEFYDPDDYIRDYEVFLKEVRKKS